MKLKDIGSASGPVVVLISSLAVFILYLFTLGPTITLEDSGDFITAAYSFGIPHPPGFPVYTILGKVFITLIPFGTIAWRVNLLSAVSSVLACFLLGLIVWRVTKSRLSAFFAPPMLGVSSWFWSQSVIAEVYTLNAMFLLLIMYVLIIWEDSRDQRYLFYLAFIYGLSLTNHLMMLLVGPALLVYVLATGRRAVLRPRTLLSCLGLFAAGLLPYAYLPIAASFDPVKNWGDPSTLDRFIKHVTMAEYQQRQFIVPLRLLGQSLRQAGLDVWSQWSPPLLLLLVPGFIALWRRRGFLWIWLAAFIPTATFAVNAANIIIYSNYYYIPVYVLICIVMALGIDWIMLKAKNMKAVRSPWSIASLSVVLTIFIGMTIWQNYAFASKRDFYLAEDFGRQVLNGLPPDSLLITTGDSYTFPSEYLQMVEGLRPDIEVMSAGDLASEAELAQAYKKGQGWADVSTKFVMKKLKKQRIFITKNLGLSKPLTLKLSGLYYELTESQSTEQPMGPVALEYRGIVEPAPLAIEARKVLVTPYILLVDYYGRLGEFEKAYYAARQGLGIDPDNPHLLEAQCAFLMITGQTTMGKQGFERAISIDPSDALGYRYLALIYYQEGDYIKAIDNLENFFYFMVVDYSQGYFTDLEFLSMLYEKTGNRKKAITVLERGIKGQEGNPAAASARKKLNEYRASN